jgi:hypothetical protein
VLSFADSPVALLPPLPRTARIAGTSYALDRVADPPIGALWIRGMEYIGHGTGALNGGHKVHTVRAVASYFDFSASNCIVVFPPFLRWIQLFAWPFYIYTGFSCLFGSRMVLYEYGMVMVLVVLLFHSLTD